MGMYLKYDERAQARVQVAARAEKAVRKSAKVAQLAAEKEYNNKRLCVEYEREERLKQSSNSALTTPSAKTIRTHLDSPFGEILQGSYVEITADLSPGKCSYGGKGHVIEKLGAGPKATFRVKYDESFGRHTEHGIPYCRITLIPTTYQHYQRNKNARPKRKRSPNGEPQEAKKAKTIPITLQLEDILIDGRSRNREKGWRAKDMGVGVKSSRQNRSVEHDNLMLVDINRLQGYLAGKGTGKTNNIGAPQNSGGRFIQNRIKGPKPLSMAYLGDAWGIGKMYASKLLKKATTRRAAATITKDATKTPCKPTSSTPKSIFECVQTSKKYHSPKMLYVRDFIRNKSLLDSVYSYDCQSTNERTALYRRTAKRVWKRLSEARIQYWECMSRAKVASQLVMRDRVLHILRNNPTKSYEQVAKDINGWCGSSSIKRWMSSYAGYCLYTQRTLPLLSAIQKGEHVAFAKHLRNNWNLPRQKILWIHYDEKWFFGWVNRANAKLLDCLGLEKSHPYLYHKNHIDKVMHIAFTAFAFDSNIDN